MKFPHQVPLLQVSGPKPLQKPVHQSGCRKPLLLFHPLRSLLMSLRLPGSLLSKQFPLFSPDLQALLHPYPPRIPLLLFPVRHPLRPLLFPALPSARFLRSVLQRTVLHQTVLQAFFLPSQHPQTLLLPVHLQHVPVQQAVLYYLSEQKLRHSHPAAPLQLPDRTAQLSGYHRFSSGCG